MAVQLGSSNYEGWESGIKHVLFSIMHVGLLLTVDHSSVLLVLLRSTGLLQHSKGTFPLWPHPCYISNIIVQSIVMGLLQVKEGLIAIMVPHMLACGRHLLVSV